jgi:hypothetical protein
LVFFFSKIASWFVTSSKYKLKKLGDRADPYTTPCVERKILFANVIVECLY